MDVNYVIILIALITCMISLFFLMKFSNQLKNIIGKKNPDYTHIIINKLSELEKNMSNNLKEEKSTNNIKNNNENIYLSEVEKLEKLGYSKEEIAKKTNKSVREVDLMLRLRKG